MLIFLINFKKTLKYNKILKKRKRTRLKYMIFIQKKNYFFNNLGKND